MRRALIALATCGLAAVAAVAPASAGRTPPPPSYRLYPAPSNLGNDAGEPTLGVDPQSGQVMFQALYETLNVSGFDRRFPGDATWRDTAPAITSIDSLDPLLKMDPVTGRTFVSQLAGACSLMAYTDDRGESWTNVPLGCGAGAMLDHQSIGIGPYVKGGPLANVPHTYPNVVYYCAQDIASAKCAASVDGGNTFLPANVAYTTQQCQLGALFGHLKAAPDGTIYLPPRYCPDLLNGTYRVGVAVSEDNGLTWNLRLVPGSSYGDAGHGSVGVAADGTVYLAWGSGKFPAGGPVNVAISRDKGRTWTKPIALGKEFKLANSRFPLSVAGDGDRAVVAYLGTPTAGDASATAFKGVWHLYASHTYDGGKTWKTYDVTPKNPVQVGPVCTAGTTCGSSRNLLDFNDMVVDKMGRVWIGFADGCTRATCDTTVREDHATIARLVGGRGLYKKYDGKLK
ncbi:MAG TPA: sialidase family protein [Mycobacteriales bacterium]|nr:sialidase family protein [Mycobacteriales bacterium]